VSGDPVSIEQVLAAVRLAAQAILSDTVDPFAAVPA
jgi:hypothetical protein